MSASGPLPDAVQEREALAERVSATVLAFPGVAGPHGGRYNDIATFRPGGRLIGVRIGEGDEPVEVGVVLGLDRPIPDVVADLRDAVSRLCGGAAVDITVGDLAVDPAVEGAATDGGGAAAEGAAAVGVDPGRMVR
ncbi:hypothetical protein [Pseudonocardia humida]|uniref:Alkaline shock family protein YloU n=1 Tax=Pseudonocardia humida TaxID=2800819 RepID=A0ABT1ADA2_9PSEU|nr:hypothetical protein [Pseudonocardia humida]MCO1660941.1 hypothetical protein [Pseudonocardia humida]